MANICKSAVQTCEFCKFSWKRRMHKTFLGVRLRTLREQQGMTQLVK